MTRLDCLAEIKRLADQRKALVAGWKAERPPRPDWIIEQGERDIEALRWAWKYIGADTHGEMNADG